jgi:sec-independent protein translocase protein TatA
MAPSPAKILIVALILLLLFGASRLSEIGKGLGEGIRNFKKGLDPDDEKEKQAKGDPKRLPDGDPAAEQPRDDSKKESS